MRYGVGSVAVLAPVLTLLSGCMATTGETLGEYVDDTSITTAGKAKLAAGNSQTLTRVGVETVRSTVYLTGIVDSPEARQHAGDLAGQVKGVRGVVNNIQVRSHG